MRINNCFSKNKSLLNKIIFIGILLNIISFYVYTWCPINIDHCILTL